MPFQIIRNDITKVAADAIVNTANPEPTYSTGTDAAIYTAAGAEKLLRERRRIGEIRPGDARHTPAFALQARYIIHTVGPVWVDGAHGEVETLQACYRNSLALASQLGCNSIAFPLIATGVYGFPKPLALETALGVIQEFLKDSDMDVTLVVFEKESYQLASGLHERVEQYIDENYAGRRMEEEYDGSLLGAASADAERRPFWARRREAAEEPELLIGAEPASSASLEDAMEHLGESFQARLFRMIDERGLKDSAVYHGANMSRKLFSKIRCSEDYIPRKQNVLALAIALKLNIDDTRDLLASAGYALSNNNKSDVILSFCIENEIYDIFEVNSILFDYDQPIIG